MEVLSFKLVSGEEVVARASENRDAGQTIAFTLSSPRVLQMQQVAAGQVGLVFVPWTLSNPDIDTVYILASSVISTYAPSANVEKAYLKDTSKIALFE